MIQVLKLMQDERLRITQENTLVPPGKIQISRVFEDLRNGKKKIFLLKKVSNDAREF